jgi:methylated-DNA-[protein]-cysteine S-methyltransferase
MLSLDCFESPIGALTVAERDGRVCLLHFGGSEADARATLTRWYPNDRPGTSRQPRIRKTLHRYFDGDVHVLGEMPVELNGTPFQRRVWTALRSIPAGTTMSYGELARRIGHGSAVRAVGAANGANPVAVIVPCHRVIGSNGTLTGYGGGLERKRWLLAHEGVRTQALF